VGVLKCQSYVQSCDFSRDGNHVITGEFNGDVKVCSCDVSDDIIMLCYDIMMLCHTYKLS